MVPFLVSTGQSLLLRESFSGSDSIRYIKSAEIKDEKLTKPWFYHSELVKGGKLTLKMGDKQDMDWGSKPEDAPPSMSDTD